MYQVIIAEDEFFVRLGIKNSVSWEKYNMQVVCDAGNGAEALRAIQKSCPDILITDLLMPGMGGQQLIESVRDAGLEPYIIVITCLEEFKTLQKMMSLGVRDYLLKATMTEAEIQASLQKAREALDKQARQLEPARAPVGNRFSQLMQAYLADESLCRQTQGALEELNLSVSGALPVVLGTIAEVYKADSQASGGLSEHICQNLVDLAGHQYTPGFRCLPLMLDERRFFLFFFPEISRSGNTPDLHALLERLRGELQDYLNIRLSLLADRAGDFARLPACCRQLLSAQKRQASDQTDGIAFLPNYRPEIRAALEIIRENLSDPDLSLRSVAEKVGLSEAYFSSLFHAEIQIPFRKYLTNIRIEEAKYLLEQGDYKIWDIACRTGFSDEGYFSKVFKKVTDVSPKDWRKL